jgi:hypothetical protein
MTGAPPSSGTRITVALTSKVVKYALVASIPKRRVCIAQVIEVVLAPDRVVATGA